MNGQLPASLKLDKDGYALVPKGLLASIETSLERGKAPRPDAHPMPKGFTLARPDPVDINEFKALYHAIGDPWLWSGRITRSDSEIAQILTRPDRTLLYLRDPKGWPLGFFEAERQGIDTLEITYFGLRPEATGRGLGAVMMEHGLAAAWSPQTTRVWLHTCTFDSPHALTFYQRQGFKAFKQKIELGPDPRLTGVLPRDAAPHIPLADFSDP